jgi:hypothetical protein
MYKIVPFKVEHLECMDVRPHELNLLDVNKLMALKESSIAVTGMIDGRIVCCGGVTPFGNGNAEIWLIPSVWVDKYKMTLCKALVKWLLQVREDLALSRMQTACLNDTLHSEWMTFLGFEKEGIMKNYHGGVDYAMWGRTKWESKVL